MKLVQKQGFRGVLSLKEPINWETFSDWYLGMSRKLGKFSQ